MGLLLWCSQDYAVAMGKEVKALARVRKQRWGPTWQKPLVGPQMWETKEERMKKGMDGSMGVLGTDRQMWKDATSLSVGKRKE